MARAGTKLDRLLERLQRVGFDRNHVRSALPSWWITEAESEPGALLELKAALSRRLGVELSSLLNDNAEVCLLAPKATRYKLRVGTDSSLLKPATASLSAIAQVVAYAARHLPSVSNIQDPASVRKDILQSGAKWLSFRALVIWCWKSGIPVIPALDLPGRRKMDAAVMFSGDRPVVLLTRNQAVSAWQLFILSHELGHLGCGHVRPEEMLVDDDLGEEWGASGVIDEEERAADTWAKRLLAGQDSIRFEFNGFWSPNGLAHAAQEQAATLQTDAGHLILRIAFETKNWALANAALKVLEPKPGAIEFAREVARGFLDFDALADDSREFLELTVGV
jgi:Zn-dependent peptidase ImmA (M78 family)